MTHNRWHLWAFAIGLGAAASSVAGAQQMSEAAGVGAVVPFELGRVDVRAGGNLYRIGSAVGVRTPFSFEATARLRLNSSGVWLGSGFEGASQVDTQPARPVFRYGIWRSFDRVQVSIGATTRSARIGGRPRSIWTDTTRVYPERGADSGRVGPPVSDTGILQYHTRGDSGSPSRFSIWSDVEGRAAWRLSALYMEVVVGGRPRLQSLLPAIWGRVGATYSVSERFALTAAAGSEPARFALGLPASNFVSVAMRVRPWRTASGSDLAPAAAFILRPAGEGSYKISYVDPGATTVELSGDFGGWRPVPLTKSSAGMWETTLALEPGTYHVNVRVNGGKWMPPPGLPQADDDFNGAVGVFVVR